MMKKLLAFLLAAMMLLSCAAVAEDNPFVTLPIDNANKIWESVGMSSDDWYSDGMLRAFLTLCVTVECSLARGDATEKFDLFDSYVAYHEELDAFIILVGYEGNSSVCMIYSPSQNYGSYMIGEGVTPDAFVATTADAYSFIKNDAEDLAAVGQGVTSALGD